MALPGAAFAIGVALMVLPEAWEPMRPGADLLQVLGPIAAALGFVAMSEVTRPLRHLNLLPALGVAGGSLFVGMAPEGIAVAWVAAGILALTALVGRPMHRERFGGGWRALLE